MIFGFGKPRTPTIRPLRSEAADSCARLHAKSFAHPWSSQEFATLLANRAVFASGAVDPVDGTLRGFILSRKAADEAEILSIAVDAALRRRGVAASLLEELLPSVAAAGAKTMFLEVDKDNVAALALYRRFSFTQVGERKGYVRRADGSTATALILRVELRGPAARRP